MFVLVWSLVLLLVLSGGCGFDSSMLVSAPSPVCDVDPRSEKRYWGQLCDTCGLFGVDRARLRPARP